MIPGRMVTPCEGGSCIALERRADGRLVLSSNQEPGEVDVTAAEVRAFAAAVVDGDFNALLDGLTPLPLITRAQREAVVRRIVRPAPVVVPLDVAAFNSAI